MNKISTGNSMLDVLCCMLVPILLRHLVSVLSMLYELVTAPFKRPVAPPAKVFLRIIEHNKDSSNYYW